MLLLSMLKMYQNCFTYLLTLKKNEMQVAYGKYCTSNVLNLKVSVTIQVNFQSNYLKR